MFPDVSSDVHAHKGTFGDTGRHAQALPEARHLHTAGLCSELRPRFSAPLSRLSSSQALSCPTPASCLALARSLALRPSHHPFVCPLALAQAPGSRMAIAPFSQVPTQPNHGSRVLIIFQLMDHWKVWEDHRGEFRANGALGGLLRQWLLSIKILTFIKQAYRTSSTGLGLC